MRVVEVRHLRDGVAAQRGGALAIVPVRAALWVARGRPEQGEQGEEERQGRGGRGGRGGHADELTTIDDNLQYIAL